MNIRVRRFLRRIRNGIFNIRAVIVGNKQRYFSEREEFLQTLPKQSVGVELGVFKGEFTKDILKIVSPEKLHLVDVWWEKYGDNYPDWGPYTDFGRLKTKSAYENVLAVIDDIRAKDKVTIHVGNDVPYLQSLPDGYFDWAYLDSSHEYEHTWTELQVLKSKIKKDGLITGHDWIEDPGADHYGVYKAVKEFCEKEGWEIILRDNFTQWCIRRSKRKV